LRIFYELFQEYKQQLLNQISQRVQAKQQQKQHDSVLYQKSLYGTAALQPEPISSSVLRVDVPPTHPASHRLPFGVRSFLDPGNREPQAALLILLRSVCCVAADGCCRGGITENDAAGVRCRAEEANADTASAEVAKGQSIVNVYIFMFTLQGLGIK